MARLTGILYGQSTNRTEAHPGTQPTREYTSLLPIDITNISSAARYFKNYKLDYPNAETNKASKKYVKAMKKLHVCVFCSTFC